MIKRLLALVIVAGMVTVIGANAAAVAAEKVVFMIDWLPAGDKAVPYLGVQKGLFAAEGLDVTIQSGRGSSDVVTKLGTGAADMGTGGLAALLQARAQTPVAVKAVMSIYTIQPDAIFTTEDSGIVEFQGPRRQDRCHSDLLLVERVLAACPEGERHRSGCRQSAQGRSRRTRAHARYR